MNMANTLTPISLPCVTSTLSNGLRVVLHEDHTSPIVAVHVMFHAGSKDERIGRTGLAHLLEHLLFEGSENCPKGEFDRLLERYGGTNNGSTWFDRTNYYEVVPSHAVEVALWLERERMAHFLPVLDEEMLEVQRSVVINERKQAYENRPYGLAHERLLERLYPREHPYSWPTIGYTADLEAITLEDARGFYETYCTPRNAVLVLAGDIDAERGAELAERYFGDLAAGPVPARNGKRGWEGTGGDNTEVMRDRVSFARTYQGYAVPPYGTEEWVALDVLSYLLADGESSRLQRALIRDGEIAQDVDAYLYPTEVSAIFGTVATARSGVSPERLTEAIDEEVRKVTEEGVGEQEVAGAIRRARRDQLSGLANMEGRADELAYAATVLGRAEALEGVLNRYGSVTAREVQEAAARYLVTDARAAVAVVPGGEARNGR
jgi:zinc protease